MPIWGKVVGFCGYCGATRDWFIKENSVVCAGCGTKRKGVAMPLQDVLRAHCGYCGKERDWIVTAEGNYCCLGCGTWRK